MSFSDLLAQTLRDFSADPTAQIFSMLGMILTVASFQFKNHRHILLFQFLGSTFFLISYWMLGVMTPVLLNVVYLVRDFVFYFRKEKKWAQNNLWLAVFCVSSVVMGLISYQEPADIVPIVGSLLSHTALYMTHENLLRVFSLGAAPCWLFYNYRSRSSGGVICEAFNLCSLAVSLWRYRKQGILRPKSAAADADAADAPAQKN